MEISENDKKTYDEMIEKLILDFTEKESEEDYSSYNIDQFLTETQQLLSKYDSLINPKNTKSFSTKLLSILVGSIFTKIYQQNIVTFFDNFSYNMKSRTQQL